MIGLGAVALLTLGGLAGYILTRRSDPAEANGGNTLRQDRTESVVPRVNPVTVTDERGHALRGDGTETVTLEELKVTFGSVDTLWTGRYLRVEIAVYTSSPGKNYQFTAWSKSSNLPPAKDDLGNLYPKEFGDAGMDIDRFNGYGPEWVAAHGLKGTPQTQWGSGGVTADVIRRDVIYYQLLAREAKSLTVELPAKNIGGSGTFRLTIPLLPR